MPLEPFDVRGGEMQPLWVTISVPAETPPGRYVGSVSVSAADDTAQEVALYVDVWDIELPLHGRLRTGFGVVMKGDIRRWYGFTGDVPEDFSRKLYKLMLSNRINPAGLYVRDVWPALSDLDWCRSEGLNALCLGNVGQATPQRLRDLAYAAEELRKRGLLDTAYAYGPAILSDDDIGRARDAFSKIRRFVPGLKRACPRAPSNPFGAMSTRG